MKNKISNYENVYSLGFVDNIDYFYSISDCNLIMTTPGLGNRHRIAEFWLKKTPLVSRIGEKDCPQIINNYNCLVGKTPKFFARCIKKVTTDINVRNKIVENGYKTALEQFDAIKFEKKINTLINEG